MSSKLSKILKLSGDLTKAELMMLNQAVVSLIKTQQDVDFKKAAITFAKGDIVSFKDSSGVLVVCSILMKMTSMFLNKRK
jgi:ABC-type transporter Mla MlaB component